MNEYIGKTIRELRKNNHLTQEQFAESLGVSFQSVSRWENGVTYPDIEMMPAIAHFFGVSTDYLFGVPAEERKERIKAKMKTLQELAEDDTNRAIETIREIRKEVDFRSGEGQIVFSDLCPTLYHSAVKKTPALLDELRRAADLYFDGNPDTMSKAYAIQYFACLEDAKYIPSLLDKYAMNEHVTRNSILYERYLYQDDFDKAELYRQRRLFNLINETIDGTIPWKEWRAPNNAEHAFWKNNACLDFLHAFTNETPTADHPVSCGLAPDVFISTRTTLGQGRTCDLAMLGRTEEAIDALEDTVWLIERVCMLPTVRSLKAGLPRCRRLRCRTRARTRSRRTTRRLRRSRWS